LNRKQQQQANSNNQPYEGMESHGAATPMVTIKRRQLNITAAAVAAVAETVCNGEAYDSNNSNSSGNNQPNEREREWQRQHGAINSIDGSSEREATINQRTERHTTRGSWNGAATATAHGQPAQGQRSNCNNSKMQTPLNQKQQWQQSTKWSNSTVAAVNNQPEEYIESTIKFH
jgi:hypothetical protein